MSSNITDLNYDWLKTTIEDFGSKGIIFDNEAQFQFELALKIKKEFDCEIKLEKNTLTTKVKSTGKKKKFYSDIYVSAKDSNRVVVIELKYKTAEYKNGDIFLFDQGAPDLGRFDYIWDIHRLEWLVYHGKGIQNLINDENTIINKANECRHEKNQLNEIEEDTDFRYDNKYQNKEIVGYAIILTNEKTYWMKKKKENTCQYHDFCIGENDKSHVYNLTGISEMDWVKNEKNLYSDSLIGSWRGRPIDLIGQYSYNWQKYKDFDNENGLFKFCIAEVLNKNNCKQKE